MPVGVVHVAYDWGLQLCPEKINCCNAPKIHFPPPCCYLKCMLERVCSNHFSPFSKWRCRMIVNKEQSTHFNSCSY